MRAPHQGRNIASQGKIKSIGIFVCLLLLIYSIKPVQAQAPQTTSAIGRVLMTRGPAFARNTAGTLRPLQRRSEILVGDSIITEAGGFAQIRMIDNAQISMSENTDFTFHEYALDDDPATPDRAIMALKSGGFRAITGTISDNNNNEYRVDSQFASIQVRGTVYECTIEVHLYCGLYDGGITLYNNLGTLDLGIGGNYDYAEVPAGLAPRPLLSQPQALSNNNLNSAPANQNPNNPATTPPANPQFPAPSPIQITPIKK